MSHDCLIDKDDNGVPDMKYNERWEWYWDCTTCGRKVYVKYGRRPKPCQK